MCVVTSNADSHSYYKEKLTEKLNENLDDNMSTNTNLDQTLRYVSVQEHINIRKQTEHAKDSKLFNDWVHHYRSELYEFYMLFQNLISKNEYKELTRSITEEEFYSYLFHNSDTIEFQ